MTNETHPELFLALVSLRDMLTRTIDANFISDSACDMIDSVCHDVQHEIASAYNDDNE